MSVIWRRDFLSTTHTPPHNMGLLTITKKQKAKDKELRCLVLRPR